MRKNVLEICESYGGGVKRQVDYLHEYVDAGRFNLTVLVSSVRGGKVPSNYIVDDRLSMLTKNPLKFISLVRGVHRLVRKKKIDLIHAHSTIAGIFMVVYKIIYHDGVPVVFTPHAYFSEVDRGRLKNVVLILIERFMSRFYKKVIHVSGEEENYALENKLVSSGKSIVVNNGVPRPTVEKKQHTGIVFINVARCSFQKNPQLFVEIAKHLIKYIPNSEFVWVGDGPLLNECRAKVEQDDVGEKIKFVGYSDNPYEYLAQADIFFSTSRYEGLPFSVLEALSLGIPLILTNIVGHRELIKKNGVLLDESSIEWEKLVKEVEYVNLNKQLMEEASRRLYVQEFSIERMISGIEDVYEKN